jgi:cell division initiation protein
MKTFTTTVNGYNKKEVNDFVSEVIAEYEKVLNKLKEKDLEISSLRKKIDNYKSLESSLNRAIVVAEDSASDIRKVAKDEARMILEDAKKNASRIINDSLLKAAQTDREVENVKQKLRIYKTRIKETIEEQLIMVDDIDKIDF